MSSSTDIEEFLKTLKIHNKDLDICFNDAVAVHRLQNLLASKEREARLNEIYHWFDKEWVDKGSANASIGYTMSEVKLRVKHLEEASE